MTNFSNRTRLGLLFWWWYLLFIPDRTCKLCEKSFMCIYCKEKFWMPQVLQKPLSEKCTLHMAVFVHNFGDWGITLIFLNLPRSNTVVVLIWGHVCLCVCLIILFNKGLLVILSREQILREVLANSVSAGLQKFWLRHEWNVSIPILYLLLAVCNPLDGTYLRVEVEAPH